MSVFIRDNAESTAFDTSCYHRYIPTRRITYTVNNRLLPEYSYNTLGTGQAVV